MRKKMQGHIDKIDGIPTIVKDALMEANKDSEFVDVIGSVKEAERRYKPDIAGAIAETAPSAGGAMRGEFHHVETKRSADRSYNTPNLMRLLQGKGFTMADLIEHRVLTLTWRWTDLKNFCEARGIELRITDSEISELGEEKFEIGEFWKDGRPRWT